MIGASVGDEGTTSWQSVLGGDERVQLALQGVGGATEQVIVAALLGILETLSEVRDALHDIVNPPPVVMPGGVGRLPGEPE